MRLMIRMRRMHHERCFTGFYAINGDYCSKLSRINTGPNTCDPAVQQHQRRYIELHRYFGLFIPIFTHDLTFHTLYCEE